MLKASLALLALPALLAGCFTGTPAPQAVATGQIDGAVVDHLLHPFSDQEVRLLQLDRTDRTSLLGGFTFREVPPGFYTVTTTLPNGATASQVVDVEAGKVTRVILQLLPAHEALPWFQSHVFKSTGERPERDQVCESCAWTLPLGAERPEEVTFEAFWATSPASAVVGGADHLHIQITDDLGFPLLTDKDAAMTAGAAYIASIDGADLHPDAKELRVEVRFGKEFLPSAQEFKMTSVLTEYFGGTRAEQFGV